MIISLTAIVFLAVFDVSFGGVVDKEKSSSTLVKNSKSLDGDMKDPMLLIDDKAE